MRSSEIRLRKLKLWLRDKRFANHKAPCTVIWQQLLQSVLALRGCSATDFKLSDTTNSPTLPSLYLRHSSFSNPSFASPTSQDFHLRHPASRPWLRDNIVASHLAGPGSIPGRVSFLRCFSSTVRQMSGKLRPPSILGYHWPS